MDAVKNGLAWVKARVSERTSWDGAVLLAGSLFLLWGGALADWMLWGAAAWGAYTIWKEEK
jgi:hypothetical protein